MRIAHIARGELLFEVTDSLLDTYHLALTSQVLSDPQYAAYYRTLSEEHYVILDNDAFEEPGKSTPFDRLELAIRTIMPDEVILPDIRGGSALECIALAKSSATRLAKYGIPFMAVPHAHDVREYVDCVDEMVLIPGVKALGIYEETYDDFRVHRREVVRLLSPYYKDLHLLGCLEDLSDILDPQVCEIVRGMDTCKFIRWGLGGEVVTRDHIPPYPGRGSDFFTRSYTPSDVEVVRRNVEYWRDLCLNEEGIGLEE